MLAGHSYRSRFINTSPWKDICSLFYRESRALRQRVWHAAEGQAGFLTEDDRVELIDGEIIEMTPIGDSHVDLVIVLTGSLTAALGPRAMVSVQNPIGLNDLTELQPDLAMLKLNRRSVADRRSGGNAHAL